MSALKLNLTPAAAASTPASGVAGTLGARDDNAAAQREHAFADLLSNGGSDGASQPGAGKAMHANQHMGRRNPNDETAHDALAWVASSRATAAGLHAHAAAETAAAATSHAAASAKAPAAT